MKLVGSIGLGVFSVPGPSVTIHHRDELVRLFGEGTTLARSELPVTLYGDLAEAAIANRRNVPPEHRPHSFGALYAPERRPEWIEHPGRFVHELDGCGRIVRRRALPSDLARTGHRHAPERAKPARRP